MGYGRVAVPPSTMKHAPSIFRYGQADYKRFEDYSRYLLTRPCKRKEQEHGKDRGNTPKKPRLVFTDVQRRTLHAIFKENKRPSKELQITISQQLGLELSTVSNFFMNARRRSLDKWQDEGSSNSGNSSSSSSTCTKA
ncbi:Hepatocyte nuclear factor 6 [Saguinus oedipus]|uniref:Hepatocyte nuclear factor 6 n=1 Tax=Saguinus oedipus TaxID=9490 RepID=A0ABQ9V3K9_SAGOE|nr:Hepatocyte nuclear factor 6 [Saguinus oedipus]